MEDDEQPPAKKMKIDFTDTVTIGAPWKGMTFQVPKNLICARSKSVSDHYAKHGYKAFVLPDWYSHGLLSTYFQLLYTGQVVLEEPETFWGSTCDFLRLYDLSKDFDDIVSKNLITDALVQYLRGTEALSLESLSEALEYVWDLGFSPMRRILVCFVASEYGDKGFLTYLRDHNSHGPSILVDLVAHYQKVVAEGKSGRVFADYDAKEFHVQAEQEE